MDAFTRPHMQKRADNLTILIYYQYFPCEKNRRGKQFFAFEVYVGSALKAQGRITTKSDKRAAVDSDNSKNGQYCEQKRHRNFKEKKLQMWSRVYEDMILINIGKLMKSVPHDFYAHSDHTNNVAILCNTSV